MAPYTLEKNTLGVVSNGLMVYQEIGTMVSNGLMVSSGLMVYNGLMVYSGL